MGGAKAVKEQQEMMLPDGAPDTGRNGPEAGGQQQEKLSGQKNAGEMKQ